MRLAMGRPQLRITPVDLSHGGYDRVFIASDGDAVLGAYPSLDALQQAARTLRRAPLLQLSDAPGRLEDERVMRQVPSDSRIYIYLNSRRNMDLINRDYFLGHAQFLPIQRDGLDRSTLNRVFGNPRNQFVLPPREPGGLPLVVMRHSNRAHVGSSMMEALTGRLGEMNLMSLWSPILSDGRRFTSVLYGIVSFDARYTFEVQQHLRAHARSQNVDDYAFMYTFRSALEQAPR